MHGEFVHNRNLKAQSAMEYLMTYGWAILIIAVVLGALFSLGVFSGASLIGNACIAGPGYYCGSLVYTHGGTLSASIGQSTGTNWGSANIIFAVQGSATGGGGGPIVIAGNTATAVAIASGQQIPLSFGIGPATVGTALAGSIWACYVTTGAFTAYAVGTGTCTGGYLTQVATLTTKAV